jgi:transcriptional regulator with XRE-family HTH domain
MTLDDWLTSTKTPDNEFATRIGVSRVTLYRFKSGKRVPDRALMEKINAETNGAVEPNDFFNIVGFEPQQVAS